MKITKFINTVTKKKNYWTGAPITKIFGSESNQNNQNQQQWEKLNKEGGWDKNMPLRRKLRGDPPFPGSILRRPTP